MTDVATVCACVCVRMCECAFVWTSELIYVVTRYPTRCTEVHTNLVRHNAHLLGSELGRTLVQHLHELQRVIDENDAHSARVWEQVWPQVNTQGQVPMPQYNESGKYLVKLFWLNAWRKVYVDDLLPLDSDDKVLLPTSPCAKGGLEFWPALVAKAVLKLITPYMAGTFKATYGLLHPISTPKLSMLRITVPLLFFFFIVAVIFTRVLHATDIAGSSLERLRSCRCSPGGTQSRWLCLLTRVPQSCNAYMTTARSSSRGFPSISRHR